MFNYIILGIIDYPCNWPTTTSLIISSTEIKFWYLVTSSALSRILITKLNEIPIIIYFNPHYLFVFFFPHIFWPEYDWVGCPTYSAEPSNRVQSCRVHLGNYDFLIVIVVIMTYVMLLWHMLCYDVIARNVMEMLVMMPIVMITRMVMMKMWAI